MITKVSDLKLGGCGMNIFESKWRMLLEEVIRYGEKHFKDDV